MRFVNLYFSNTEFFLQPEIDRPNPSRCTQVWKAVKKEKAKQGITKE